jgi:hypothetical protein
MPYFTAADGNYPYRPRKEADPMFRLVRESAERTALSVVPAGSSKQAPEPLVRDRDIEAG